MGIFSRLFSDKQKSTCAPKTVYCPVAGTVIPLEKVDDPAFAQGMMGPGAAIEPEDGTVYAPVDGEIAALFPTGHAIGMKSTDGIELLIHIGIDTVEMNGKGFKALVKQGDTVKAGMPLIKFDIAEITAEGHKATTMILNSNAHEMGKMIIPDLEGKKAVGDVLFRFE